MEIATSIALWTLFVLLFLYALLAEFIDTIGRLEIIEQRWPTVWRIMSNRPFRLTLLLFLVVLVAKDVSERWKGATAVPVVTIVTPSAPAPIITFVQVQPPSGRQLGAGMISQRGRNNQASPVTVYGSQTTKGNGSPIYNGSNNHSPSPPQ